MNKNTQFLDKLAKDYISYYFKDKDKRDNIPAWGLAGKIDNLSKDNKNRLAKLVSKYSNGKIELPIIKNSYNISIIIEGDFSDDLLHKEHSEEAKNYFKQLRKIHGL